MGGMVNTVMSFLMSMFGDPNKKGGLPTDMSRLLFQPHLIDAFTKEFTLGGIQAAPAGTTGPGGTTGTVAPGLGGGGAVGAQSIYDYLKQNGVSPASAAGILANIRYESNFNPFNASGDGGTSGGLFQHHAGRWAP